MNPLTAQPQPSIAPKTRFSERVLRKWAESRAEWSRRGSIGEFAFHFQGTTCSNGGIPIHCRAVVRLEFCRNNSRVREARFRPTERDQGLQASCSYLNNAELLLAQMDATERFCGMTVDQVLECLGEPAPSGCFCNHSHQEHKWAMVFETLNWHLKNGEFRPESDTDHSPIHSK